MANSGGGPYQSSGARAGHAEAAGRGGSHSGPAFEHSALSSGAVPSPRISPGHQGKAKVCHALCNCTALLRNCSSVRECATSCAVLSLYRDQRASGGRKPELVCYRQPEPDRHANRHHLHHTQRRRSSFTDSQWVEQRQATVARVYSCGICCCMVAASAGRPRTTRSIQQQQVPAPPIGDPSMNLINMQQADALI